MGPALGCGGHLPRIPGSCPLAPPVCPSEQISRHQQRTPCSLGLGGASQPVADHQGCLPRGSELEGQRLFRSQRPSVMADLTGDSHA